MPANPNQPTRFANWSRYFNANKSAATSEADKLAERQRKAAEAAQKATAGQLGQFSQQARAGSGAGVGGTQGAQPAQATNVGNASMRGNMQPGQQRPAMVGAVVDMGLSAEQQMMQANENGLQEYSGPQELGDVEGTDAAYAQNLAAQKGLNQLGSAGGIEALNQEMHPGQTSGESKFGAALLGTAGRGKFDALKGQFSLQKDWEAAEEKAKALAAQGTEAAKKAAAEWQARAATLKKGLEDEAAAKQKTVDDAKGALKSATKVSMPAGVTSQAIDHDMVKKKVAGVSGPMDARLSDSAYNGATRAEQENLSRLASWLAANGSWNFSEEATSSRLALKKLIADLNSRAGGK